MNPPERSRASDRLLSSTGTRAALFMKVAVLLLSALLFLIIGVVGEGMLNLVYVGLRDGEGEELGELPMVSELVISSYPLNSGRFAASMTPFIILALGLAITASFRDIHFEFFLLAFVGMWLLALIYVALLAVALILPFEIMLVRVAERYSYPIVIINSALTAGLLFWNIRNRKAAGGTS